MRDDAMSLGAWATVGDGCEIAYRIHEGEVELRFGGGDAFEFLLSEGALRTLVATGEQALQEVERGHQPENQ
jgi:hypothetical protein